MHGPLIALALACAQAAPPEETMQVDLAIPDPQVSHPRDLRIRATLTNRTEQPVQLDRSRLEMPSLVLEVRGADGRAVPKAPPPVPRVDDGVTGRTTLAPGEALALEYRGSSLIAVTLDPGRYEARFRFDAGSAEGDWRGELRSEWVPFRLE